MDYYKVGLNSNKNKILLKLIVNRSEGSFRILLSFEFILDSADDTTHFVFSCYTDATFLSLHPSNFFHQKNFFHYRGESIGYYGA